MRPVDVSRDYIVKTGVGSLVRMGAAINRLLNRYNLEVNFPGPPFLIRHEPEVVREIELIAYHHGVAYSCLFFTGDRRMNNRQRARREQRILAISNAIAGLPIPNLRNRGFRNALAHIDERIELKLLEKLPVTIVENIIVNDRNFLGSKDPMGNIVENRILFVKCYFGFEDLFVVLDESISLRNTYTEITHVLKCLNCDFNGNDEIHGQVLPYNSYTF